MKLVGEAANEMAYTLNPNKRFVLLGIVNWTTIINNHMLTKNVLYFLINGLIQFLCK